MVSQFDNAYQLGYNDAEDNMKDLTVYEFARLAYLLSEDSSIDHENAGILIYKLHMKIKCDALTPEG